jgi:hypothetical protein
LRDAWRTSDARTARTTKRKRGSTSTRGLLRAPFLRAFARRVARARRARREGRRHGVADRCPGALAREREPQAQKEGGRRSSLSPLCVPIHHTHARGKEQRRERVSRLSPRRAPCTRGEAGAPGLGGRGDAERARARFCQETTKRRTTRGERASGAPLLPPPGRRCQPVRPGPAAARAPRRLTPLSLVPATASALPRSKHVLLLVGSHGNPSTQLLNHAPKKRTKKQHAEKRTPKKKSRQK